MRRSVVREHAVFTHSRAQRGVGAQPEVGTICQRLQKKDDL